MAPPSVNPLRSPAFATARLSSNGRWLELTLIDGIVYRTPVLYVDNPDYGGKVLPLLDALLRLEKARDASLIRRPFEGFTILVREHHTVEIDVMGPGEKKVIIEARLEDLLPIKERLIELSSPDYNICPK